MLTPEQIKWMREQHQPHPCNIKHCDTEVHCVSGCGEHPCHTILALNEVERLHGELDFYLANPEFDRGVR